MDFDDIDILDLHGEDALDFLLDMLNDEPKPISIDDTTDFETGAVDMIDRPLRHSPQQYHMWFPASIWFLTTLDYN